MNYITSHLNNQATVEINLGDSQNEQSKTNQYRVLTLGFGLDIFMTDKQLEMLFKELDAKLHEPTETVEALMKELAENDETIYVLKDDLDKANETLEYLRETKEEERNNRYRR